MKTRLALLAPLALLGSWLATPAQEPAAKADARDVVFLGPMRPLLLRLDIRMHGKPLQAAWDELIDYLFKYADQDGDGVLSKAEADAAPQPQSLLNSFAFGGFGMQAGGGGMDANGDGKVTRQEFADYYRRSGLPPFQVHVDSARPTPQRFGAMKRTPPAGQLTEALVKRLDTDGDGKLSRAELAAAERLLLKIDNDEDEVITPQELLPDFLPVNGFEAFVNGGRQPPQPPLGNEKLFLASAVEPRRVAQALLGRYGQNGKKKTLTRGDLGLDVATFTALDRDGNGELDAEELAQFTARAPDLSFVVRVGDRGPREAAVELIPRQGGPMSVKARPAGSSLVLVLGDNRLALRVGEAPARSQLGFLIREQYKQVFRQADRDNNGYVDEKEAQQSGLSSVFKAMDRDGDGKVYEKELLAYIDTIEDMQTRATTSCVSLTFSDSGRGLFELFDTDRDGRLSLRELKYLPRLVDELGRGRDGDLDPRAVPHSYLFNLEQGAGGGGTNPYAVFEAMGMNTERSAARGPGPVWFHKMDRNRDGDVSRREFLGSEALFRRIDTDGDGLISMAEALRFDEALKAGKRRAQ